MRDNMNEELTTELKNRIKKVKEEMIKEKIDAMLISNPMYFVLFKIFLAMVIVVLYIILKKGKPELSKIAVLSGIVFYAIVIINNLIVLFS